MDADLKTLSVIAVIASDSFENNSVSSIANGCFKNSESIASIK